MITWLAFAAGAGDALTGLLLLSAPAFTLSLLGIAEPQDPMMVRFLGNFVAAVGLATLVPLLSPAPRRWQRLAVAFELSALVRLMVAGFLGFSILNQLLAPAWWIVAFFDLGLAILLLIVRPRVWSLAQSTTAGFSLSRSSSR